MINFAYTSCCFSRVVPKNRSLPVIGSTIHPTVTLVTLNLERDYLSLCGLEHLNNPAPFPLSAGGVTIFRSISRLIEHPSCFSRGPYGKYTATRQTARECVALKIIINKQISLRWGNQNWAICFPTGYFPLAAIHGAIIRSTWYFLISRSLRFLPILCFSLVSCSRVST